MHSRCSTRRLSPTWYFVRKRSRRSDRCAGRNAEEHGEPLRHFRRVEQDVTLREQGVGRQQLWPCHQTTSADGRAPAVAHRDGVGCCARSGPDQSGSLVDGRAFGAALRVDTHPGHTCRHRQRAESQRSGSCRPRQVIGRPSFRTDAFEAQTHELRRLLVHGQPGRHLVAVTGPHHDEQLGVRLLAPLDGHHRRTVLDAVHGRHPALVETGAGLGRVDEIDAGRPHDDVVPAVLDGRAVAGSRGEVQPMPVVMRGSGGQVVGEEPVLAGDEDDVAGVHGVVTRAVHLGAHDVEVVGAVPPEDPPTAARPCLGLPRRYGVWSRSSTVTVLCAAVPLNQRRQLGPLSEYVYRPGSTTSGCPLAYASMCSAS